MMKQLFTTLMMIACFALSGLSQQSYLSGAQALTPGEKVYKSVFEEGSDESHIVVFNEFLYGVEGGLKERELRVLLMKNESKPEIVLSLKTLPLIPQNSAFSDPYEYWTNAFVDAFGGGWIDIKEHSDRYKTISFIPDDTRPPTVINGFNSLIKRQTVNYARDFCECNLNDFLR